MLAANILGALATILHGIIFLYIWVVIIAALISWVQPNPYNPLVRALRGLTEPVFWRLRKHMPFLYINGLDLSPMALILGLYFIDMALVSTLADWAMSMKINR